MSRQLVSILVPCYNASPYLRATLDSALAQTHPDIEVILVDDGSSDDSLAIARTYEPRIKVIAGPQKGASEARNAATRQSEGEFLQYLDADDLLLPGAVANRVRALGETAGDVACGDWRRIHPSSDGSWKPGALEAADYQKFDAEADLAVLKGFWAPPAALLYRRSIVEKIGGWNPALPVIQDARFLFDAAFHGGQFVHVPGDGAHYRQHSANSLSSRSKAKFWGDVLRNTRDIEALYSGAGSMSPARRDAVGKAYGLGARATFLIDRELHLANLGELRRFPEQLWSPYLRTAFGLEKIFGYAAAARMMKILRPGQNP